MKNRRSIVSILTILILGLLVWWLLSSKPTNSKLAGVKPSTTSVLSPKPLAPVVNITPVKPSQDALAAALASPEIQTILNNPDTSQKVKDEITANPVAALQRIQAFQNIQNRENSTPINFYGKVMDQYGKPIDTVTVEGGVMLYGGFTQSKSETYNTQTDTQGRFSFVGLHGVDFGVNFQKDGYFYDLKISSKRPDNYYTTEPDHPIIYTMWKLKGAEPMVHLPLVQGGIPYDGSETNFNLLTGRKNDPVKDMVVKLLRNPLAIDRNKPFDWNLTLSIPDGGLSEASDSYPYQAPEGGYQPLITVNMPATDKNWSSAFDKLFYFKARNGQVYGRIKVHLTANYEGATTHFEFELYANPSGSRNLEWDPAKENKSK